MMSLVSPFKLQVQLFCIYAFLYIFFIFVTFVAVVFSTAFYRNDNAEMSQSLLFRTMHAVVMGCVCQLSIKKLLLTCLLSDVT